MEKVIGIVLALIVLSGFLYANQMKKVDGGFQMKSPEVKTYYVNRIIWGDDYMDHDNGKPVHNTEVIAYGEDWSYSTTTDDDGYFKVQVKNGSKFKIKASDGNRWAESEDLNGIPLGETRDERTDKTGPIPL